MRIDEAISLLKQYIDYNNPDVPDFYTMEEACKVVIKALEQEPCGDVVSRQAALEAIDVKAWEFCDYLIRNGRNDEQKPVSHFADNLRECVGEDLPSVTAQQKIGKWIMSDDGLYRPICNNCGAHPWKGYIPTVEEATEAFKYCPHCGRKMQEAKE